MSAYSNDNEYSSHAIQTFPESPSVRRRNPVPDVPEDVALLHFNDPNWEPPTSATYTNDTFEIEERKADTLSSRHSHKGDETDAESQTESSVYKSAVSRLQLRAEEEYNDDSPYAEVRAAISNVDDPSMPVNTFRMWFIGVIVSIVMSAINHVMSFRYPTVTINVVVVQLITLPFGKFLAWVLPRTKFNTFGYVWSLNPSPFNIKEHTVITIMANLLYNDAYATNIIAVQEVFFGQQLTFAYKITLVLGTQLLGYSYAGLVRQYLVWPSSMIWPGALVECALLNTLHKNYGNYERNHMSREKFFFIVTGAGALYYFFPGYIFTGLSFFTWVCWIAPENQTVNTLFGFSSGLGMGFLTFDWSMISWLSSPLIAPWWAEANMFAGFLFFMWFLSPILYYKNVFFAKFMPISAAMAFDNTGAPYDISAVVTNGVFDVEKYKAYSPLFLPATFYVSYGAQFAAMSGVIVHVFLWYRHDIVRQFRRTVRDERDVHSRLMAHYPEVPHWWYLGLGVIASIFAIVSNEIFPTEFPVWGLVVAIVFGLFFIVPIGIIRAVTNQMITLNVFSEFIGGFMLPQRPVAVMIFKTYSFVSVAQGISFVSDLKIGHYMKIPPRTMFMAQTISTLISAFVIVGSQSWMMHTVRDVCTPQAAAGFTCPPISTFATSSVIWGGIGPLNMFSSSALYHPLLYFILAGAILPIPAYFLARRFPHSRWRYVNLPLILSSTSQMPPSSGINYSSWIMVGAFFQWFMRRYHFRWWMRYNYILSAALDSGVVIGSMAVFFFLYLPKGGVTFNWWGNTVWMNTFDALGMPAISLAPGDTFGPKTW